MQTKFVKYSAFIFLFTAQVALAQQKPSRAGTSTNTSYNISNDETGQAKETVNTVVDNTRYKLELINGKITSLYVDEKLVAPDQYGKYDLVITKIKEQMRIDRVQAKKDQEQAMIDQKKAKLDQEQAAKDQVAAKLDQEKAAKDQAAAKLDQEEAAKDQWRQSWIRKKQQRIRQQQNLTTKRPLKIRPPLNWMRKRQKRISG